MVEPNRDALEGGGWVVVKGVRRWVEDPPPADIIPHGTDSGYYFHRRLKVEQCDPCIAAHTAEQAARDGRQPTGRTHRPVAVCGTPSGYKKHRRNLEPPCDACTEANRAANAERREYFRAHRRMKKYGLTMVDR
jgi:hypothetical protein